MKHKLLTIFRWLLPSIITLILVGGIMHALGTNNGDNVYTVAAVVEPHRYIVTDNNLQIKEIISNTNQDVRPTVLLNSIDGQEVPYSDSIRQQYQFLKRFTNFSQAGVVYMRPHRNPVVQAVDNIYLRLKNVIL